MGPIAHSGRVKLELGPQTYACHVRAVRERALKCIHNALKYRAHSGDGLETTTELASLFHDLGKLESENQRVLLTSEHGSLPINHVDAGVAHLRALRQPEAAIAVHGHHRGLCDLPSEQRKDELSRQDPAQAALRDYAIKLQTDANLGALLALHQQVIGIEPAELSPPLHQWGGFERRLLLSCLVDADHGDTARNYSQEPERVSPPCRWGERLAALNAYIASLQEHGGQRAELRQQIYSACRGASPKVPVWACDSPVGSGKTTAIMAYLLQAAIALDLRHIFVVLPYSNIIRQSVKVYRRALALQGEDPEMIVAAHHHQAEFTSPDLRYLTTLWEAPIIVTTAVQFFETLGSNETARLRKLHQLPGSAVFIDEAHAAMPIHLWPYMLDQLKCLAASYSCRFVLGSGSLAKFWENPRIVGEGKTETLPSMIPEKLRSASSAFETQRICYRSRPEALSLAAFCDWIMEEQFAGSRLVILNTVQSAAVVAQELNSRRVNCLHLSTALAPVDRERILTRVTFLLNQAPQPDFVLVATSCVEAGVDLSFDVAFRERSRVTSLVQIGGRVNRHGEHMDGLVWDFIVNDPLLSLHPEFKHGREVVQEVFAHRMWERDLTELVTYALEEEFKRHSGEAKIAELFRLEKQGSYPDVGQLTKLIQTDTRLVVVDPNVISALRKGRHVEPNELQKHSVQLWSDKIRDLALSEIGQCGSGLYAWEYEYDPEFLGIMAGVLKLNKIERDQCAMI